MPNERKKGTFCVNALWSRRKIYIYICELVQKERERVCVCLTKNVRRNKNDTCARLYSKEERKKMSRISMMMSVILRARDETEREVSQGERGMPHLCIVRAFF